MKFNEGDDLKDNVKASTKSCVTLGGRLRSWPGSQAIT